MSKSSSKILSTGFVFVNIFLINKANANSIENVMSMATDSTGAQVFVLNPAIYVPKSFSLSYGQSLRLNDVKLQSYGDTPFTIRGKTDERIYSLNISGKMANSVTFGLQLDYNKRLDGTNLDTSGRYASTPAPESMTKKSVSGRFAIDLVQNLRVGVVFKYSHLNSTVIGNFGFAQDETTSFHGTMTTLGAGAWLNSEQLGFAAMYLLPERGKVNLLGEDRVITEPGIIMANMHYELSKEFKFGLGLQKDMYEKDEMSETVKIDESWISLNGLNPDRDIYLLQSVFFGADYLMTSLVQLRMSVGVEQWEYNTNQANLKSHPNKSNQFQCVRPRLAINILHKDAIVSVGAEYAQRKLDKSGEDNSPFKLSTVDTSLFGSFALNF